MVRFFRARFFSLPRRGSATVLAFTLCCGYLLGSVIATLSGNLTSSLMPTALCSRVSIVSLLPVILLPFLFTAFAVYIGHVWLLIPIAFCKSFLIAYLSSWILCLYGGSGWLILLLFLFSDCITLPILCWFWIRTLDNNRSFVLRSFGAMFIFLLGIVSFDCHYISPFLVSLLS